MDLSSNFSGFIIYSLCMVGILFVIWKQVIKYENRNVKNG